MGRRHGVATAALLALIWSCGTARENLTASGELQFEFVEIPEHSWEASAYRSESGGLLVEGRLVRRGEVRRRFLGDVAVKLVSSDGAVLDQASTPIRTERRGRWGSSEGVFHVEFEDRPPRGSTLQVELVPPVEGS